MAVIRATGLDHLVVLGWSEKATSFVYQRDSSQTIPRPDENLILMLDLCLTYDMSVSKKKVTDDVKYQFASLFLINHFD